MADSKVKVVQIAPGLYVDRAKHPSIQRGRWMHLDDAGYRAIGVTVKQRNSLERLYEAGMIRMSKVSPRIVLLDLDSWEKHVQLCADDPWYWDAEKNLNAYRGTYGKCEVEE
jgi:hypothetical protein